jgi:hypothetical protein
MLYWMPIGIRLRGFLNAFVALARMGARTCAKPHPRDGVSCHVPPDL